jgi:RNA polymerase sigma factor (sigma-70 family)
MSEAAAPRGMRSGAGAARLLSDDRLARRAIDGDERAFSAIYRRYHQSLYRFCLAIVGNSQDAQDALQNTMVKVLRALPGEQRRIELKPWLYRIAHNESIELLRRRRGTEELDPELATTGSGLADEVELRERLRRLVADLDRLPERQRGALVMRELAGLDFDEIAAALGTSAAVARQTLYEARLSLRQMEAGREMSCALVTRALSDADGRVIRRRDIRAHLRSCPDCRRFQEEVDSRRHDLAALSPLPAAAAAGLLHGLLGGQGGSGAGLAGALGGGAAKSLGVSAAVKSAAAVAVVAAVGITAADRGGLIDVAPSHRAEPQQTRSPRPAGSAARAAASRAARLSAAGPRVGTAASLPAGVRGGRAADAASSIGKETAPGTDAASAGSDSLRSSHNGSGVHAHGRGHEKQLPAASAHGQQTAAAHKAAGHRGGHSHGHKAASHPPHPAKPAQPAKEPGAGLTKKGPSKATEPSSSPPTRSQEGSAPRATEPREASSPPLSGEQP